ncbi:MAG: Recombination protein RecR [Alphaproteobacteria bacterium MarineAlpha11_Bin1]|nr:MAG: Recombination protein RecR [Alphaproteobacteria bacterium MarineAlpha11_Bin1]|tara:strand:+ start:1979 stop:2629 length:651 start_codon:yes stop_codon:yes gene_type:complete
MSGEEEKHGDRKLMSSKEIELLIQMLSKLPGLGPRSARRAALHLIKYRDSLLEPLASAMARAAVSVTTCGVCGNLDSTDPCTVCADSRRDRGQVCVVEDVSDLWALERVAAFKGVYHVIGGTLSALDGRGPEDLNISSLISRVVGGNVTEIILANSATVEGQTTAHYISDRIEDLVDKKDLSLNITRLAQGVPVGGELNYLDDGTLSAALKARRPV